MAAEIITVENILSAFNNGLLTANSGQSDFARNLLILLIHSLLSHVKIFNIINELHISKRRSPTGC